MPHTKGKQWLQRGIMQHEHVFFYEAFEEERQAIARYCPSTLQASYTARAIQETGHAEPPAPVVSVRTQSIIPVSWAPKLHAVLTRSAGYDHLQRFSKKWNAPAPLCGYLPLYCVNAVAEQAMLLWMALLRKLPRQMRQFDRFERDHLTGQECAGKNLVVVGVGRIGRRILQLGEALGMQGIGVDIEKRFPDVSYLPIDTALSQADIIVAAMNLTGENVHYFNMERWRRARRGALFVNIARGELAAARDLEQAMLEGCLSGIALDVYSGEAELAVCLRAGREFPSHPEHAALERLREMEHVLTTPHNAFNTAEAVERKAEQSVRQLMHLRKTGAFLWPCPTSAASGA